MKTKVLVLTVTAFFVGLVLFRQSALPQKVQAQIQPPPGSGTCNPECLALGGFCTGSRAECDLQGGVPLTCSLLPTDPNSCVIHGNGTAGSVCCIPMGFGNSCETFRTQGDCDLANIWHACLWNPITQKCQVDTSTPVSTPAPFLNSGQIKKQTIPDYPGVGRDTLQDNNPQ